MRAWVEGEEPEARGRIHSWKLHPVERDPGLPFLEEKRSRGLEPVSWEALEPGPYRLELLGVGQRTLTVAAGAISEVPWFLDGVVHARGHVQGPDERPVEGADVWVSTYSNREEGDVVARSGVSGAFDLLLGLDAERWIAASHPDLGASVPVLLQASRHLDRAEHPELVLVLKESGPAISGFVRTSEGRPIEGARVELRTIQGGDPTLRAPVRTRTGEDGSFDLPGPAPRVLFEVRARAPGFAEVSRSALDGHVPRQGLVLALPREVRVRGRVVDAEGTPVVGVMVLTGMPGRSGTCQARSRETGEFELEGVSPGHGRVLLQLSGFETVEVPIEGAAGRTLELGDVLLKEREGSWIQGRVEPPTGPFGEPWSLRIGGDGVQTLCFAQEGRFRFRSSRPARVQVDVGFDRVLDHVVERQDLLVPERGEVILTLSPSATQVATYRGSVAQRGGKIEGALVRLRCLGVPTLRTARVSATSGAFTFQLPVQGVWMIELLDREGQLLGTWDLGTPQPGDLDLGVLEYGSGWLTVESGSEESPQAPLLVRNSGGVIVHRGGVESFPVELPAGPYRVERSGTEAVAGATGFVLSGLTTNLSLEADDFGLLELVDSGDATGSRSVRVVRTADGVAVLSRSARSDTLLEGRWWLRAGSYRIEAYEGSTLLRTSLVEVESGATVRWDLH